MCQKLLGDARLYALLLKYDENLAADARAKGCLECGGRLDSARYPRKPRGSTTRLPDEYYSRLSFCCAVEGCRHRCTPPSLRFLGRRVYLGAVVVLAAAMQQGATPVRARRLKELIGVSPRTLARWREWWASAFLESAFWKEAKARFSPPVDEAGFPASLLGRFAANERERLVALLRFLAPVSTSAGYIPDQRL